MAKPIKKNLLIHEISVTPYDVKNNDDFYGERTVVKHVRVEPIQKTITDQQGNTVGVSHLLFVDALHSTPFVAADYVVNTNIEFDGESLTVVAVEKLYTKVLHHLEVLLA